MLNGGRAVDAAGATASFVCAVHCLALAFAPWVFAGLGATIAHEAEWPLVLIAVGLALVAGWLGYRRHRSRWLAVSLSALPILLILSRVLEEQGAGWLGLAVAVLSGLGLVVAHAANWRAAPCEDHACVTPQEGA